MRSSRRCAEERPEEEYEEDEPSSMHGQLRSEKEHDPASGTGTSSRPKLSFRESALPRPTLVAVEVRVACGSRFARHELRRRRRRVRPVHGPVLGRARAALRRLRRCGGGRTHPRRRMRPGRAHRRADEATRRFGGHRDRSDRGVRRRRPGAEPRGRRPAGSAEELPFPAGEFDAALAQLVVHFMDIPSPD